MRMYSFTSYTERTSARRDKFYITPNQDNEFGTNINNMLYNNNLLLKII